MSDTPVGPIVPDENVRFVDGVKYTAVAGPTCQGCAFRNSFFCSPKGATSCLPDQRQDRRSIVWVKASADCFYCGNAQPGPHRADCATVRGSSYVPPATKPTAPTGGVRAFETGATRSSEAGRYDPEGYLSPLAIERYCEYMAAHQRQPDGSIRASDNWQKGLPAGTYMKGMWRHFLHLWTRHRGHRVRDVNAAANEIEDLCALLFNVQGMLHELLKQEGGR